MEIIYIINFHKSNFTFFVLKNLVIKKIIFKFENQNSLFVLMKRRTEQRKSTSKRWKLPPFDMDLVAVKSGVHPALDVVFRLSSPAIQFALLNASFSHFSTIWKHDGNVVLTLSDKRALFRWIKKGGKVVMDNYRPIRGNSHFVLKLIQDLAGPNHFFNRRAFDLCFVNDSAQSLDVLLSFYSYNHMDMSYDKPPTFAPKCLQLLSKVSMRLSEEHIQLLSLSCFDYLTSQLRNSTPINKENVRIIKSFHYRLLPASSVFEQLFRTEPLTSNQRDWIEEIVSPQKVDDYQRWVINSLVKKPRQTNFEIIASLIKIQYFCDAFNQTFIWDELVLEQPPSENQRRLLEFVSKTVIWPDMSNPEMWTSGNCQKLVDYMRAGGVARLDLQNLSPSQWRLILMLLDKALLPEFNKVLGQYKGNLTSLLPNYTVPVYWRASWSAQLLANILPVHELNKHIMWLYERKIIGQKLLNSKLFKNLRLLGYDVDQFDIPEIRQQWSTTLPEVIWYWFGSTMFPFYRSYPWINITVERALEIQKWLIEFLLEFPSVRFSKTYDVIAGCAFSMKPPCLPHHCQVFDLDKRPLRKGHLLIYPTKSH